jgi:uncharacterized protein YdaU (DUF1376 family)
MNNDSNSGNGGGRKSRDPLDPDRYSWHEKNHLVAIATKSDLKPEQRGIYETIIEHCYARRGPLPNDDVWLAKINNCDIRIWRRVKEELRQMARIVVDEENGWVYDERAFRTLVKQGLFSAKQAERARGGGKNKAPARAKGRPQLSVIEGNVAALPADEIRDLALTVGLTIPVTIPGTIPGIVSPKFEPTEPNSKTWVEPDASHRTRTKDISQHHSTPGPAATLPRRGSGGADLKKQRQQAALDALRQHRPAEPPKGFDATGSGTASAAESETPKPAADRTARRA